LKLFELSTFIYQIIAFLILYWLLKRYAFGPLMGIMEKRKQYIQDQIQTTEKNRQASDILLEEQKQAIQQARKEAYDIMEQSRVMSAKQADDLIQQAKSEAGRQKADMLADIESEKNKAVVALRSQVSAMSVLIASKILEKQVDEKSQQELIDNYLNKVGGNQ
jgi:F-type H+-transporting ATPase subunit b